MRRKRVLQVRLSEEEHEAVKARAQEAGYTSSEYARAVLLFRARGRPGAPESLNAVGVDFGTKPPQVVVVHSTPPQKTKARTEMCVHRIPVGAYCKVCGT